MLSNIFSALNLVTVLALFVAVSSKPTRDFRNRRLGDLDPRGFAEHKPLKQFNIRSHLKRRNLNNVPITIFANQIATQISDTDELSSISPTSSSTSAVTEASILTVMATGTASDNPVPTPNSVNANNKQKLAAVSVTASITSQISSINGLSGSSSSTPAAVESSTPTSTIAASATPASVEGSTPTSTIAASPTLASVESSTPTSTIAVSPTLAPTAIKTVLAVSASAFDKPESNTQISATGTTDGLSSPTGTAKEYLNGVLLDEDQGTTGEMIFGRQEV